MLFVSDFNNEIFGKNYVVVGYKEVDSDNNEVFYNALEIFTSPELNEKLSACNKFVYVWTTYKRFAFPIVAGDSELAQENDDVINLNVEEGMGIEDIDKLILFDKTDELYSCFEGLLTEEQLKEMTSSMMLVMNKMKKMEFNLPRLPIQESSVKNVIYEYNKESSVPFNDYLKVKQMESLQHSHKQKNCEDKFFIKLPDFKYSECVENFSEDSNYIWEQDSFYNPLGDNLMNINFNSVDSILKDVPSDDIHGHKELDTLGIQPNERVFYNYVIEYIDANLKNYQSVFDISDETIESIKTGCKLTTRLANIFSNLIRFIMNKNWRLDRLQLTRQFFQGHIQ